MINHMQGDLLSTQANIICHQVNCRGVMGAGLARQIRTKYPATYTAYAAHCQGTRAIDLLGTFQTVNRFGDSWVNELPVHNPNQRLIVHMFGQLDYGRNRLQTNYAALQNIFKHLHQQMIEKNYRSVAMPYGIGCGLAGGDWKIVSSMLETEFQHDPHVTLQIVRYTK